MTINQSGDTPDPKRFKIAASKIARCYRAGLGRCFSLTVAPGTHSHAADLLRASLTDLDLRCSVTSICHTRQTRPIGGIQIIDNADALISPEITAWMKTALDVQTPPLRLILIHKAPHDRVLMEHLDLLGAVAVEW